MLTNLLENVKNNKIQTDFFSNKLEIMLCNAKQTNYEKRLLTTLFHVPEFRYMVKLFLEHYGWVPFLMQPKTYRMVKKFISSKQLMSLIENKESSIKVYNVNLIEDSSIAELLVNFSRRSAIA